MKCKVCGTDSERNEPYHGGCEAVIIRMIEEPWSGDAAFLDKSESDGRALSLDRRLSYVTREMMEEVRQAWLKRTVLFSTKIHLGD